MLRLSQSMNHLMIQSETNWINFLDNKADKTWKFLHVICTAREICQKWIGDKSSVTW